ncbi:Adenosylcobinamide-phosphate guanylyltransferase [Klebsiella pneumoniae]|nr:Adenosylcobinamide-phosphate guanylyltransferase [Klebsiella pneumoniae]
MLTLVTGGARSGKSRHAEALIADAPQVLYIATSQIFDDEMAARIQHHRDGRPAHWRTAERWQQLDELITPGYRPSGGDFAGMHHHHGHQPAVRARRRQRPRRLGLRRHGTGY